MSSKILMLAHITQFIIISHVRYYKYHIEYRLLINNETDFLFKKLLDIHFPFTEIK